MPNLIETALDLHIQRLEITSGVELKIHVGAAVVEVTGIPGRSLYSREDGVEEFSVEAGTFDWMVRTAALVLNGERLKPSHGMAIETPDGAVFDVMSADARALWSVNDAFRLLTRIHTVLRSE